MGDRSDWDSWHTLLGVHPGLYSDPFLEFLRRIRPKIREEDLWVLYALLEFLDECRREGPHAATDRWRYITKAGERSLLPAEYKIVALSHLAETLGSREDLTGASAFGNLGIPALFTASAVIERRISDVRRNYCRSAAKRAQEYGTPRLRAGYQQALVNTILLLDPEQNAELALTIACEALEGWERQDEPALWGLLKTSQGNCLMRLNRTSEAIECYQASLTVFARKVLVLAGPSQLSTWAAPT